MFHIAYRASPTLDDIGVARASSFAEAKVRQARVTWTQRSILGQSPEIFVFSPLIL